jgi:mono/diheme cytochrome c family protein
VKKFILGLIVGLLLPVIGGYLYLKMGMMPVAANGATPMPMEEKIANMALEARISKEAPKTAPVAADEANMTEGAHVYVEHCAFCHGFSGEKASFAAKGMFPLPPQLLSEHMVNDDPVGETYWKVSHGIRLTGMPGFNEMLTPTQMWQVSQMLAHADKLPDQTKAALAKPPAIPGGPVPHLQPMETKKPNKK